MLKFIIACGVLALVNCAYGGAPADQGSTASGPSVTIVMGARTMSNMAYSPASLTVTRGATVVWMNGDSMNHTVTSDTSVFDSGNMTAGASYSFTFTTAGTFPYHCGVHPSMTGSIVVQ